MNRITDLKFTRFDVPLKTPLRVTFAEIRSISSIIVKVTTEEGVVGLGEAAPFSPVTGETIDTVISALTLFREGLIGMEATDIEGAHAMMDKVTAHNTSAKCAIDIAIHDITAKLMGVPLYKALGGGCATVKNDITIGIGEPERMAASALEAVCDGFKILKIKVGIDPDSDVRAISLIREAVGNAITIRIDANQGYSVPRALDVINRMRAYGVAAVEQCLPAWDIEGAAAVRAQSNGMCLMLDETIHSPHDAARAAALHAADAFNIKLMKCGGLYNAMKINAIAEASGINCMVGCMLETKIGITAGLSLVASRANITEADCDSFLLSTDPEMGMSGGFTRDGGTMTLGNEPGLGIKFDF